MDQPAKPNHSVTNPDHVSPDDPQTTPPPAGAMKKRLLLTLGVMLIAVVGLIIWASSALRQRTYNGKPESYWINSLARPFSPTSVTRGVVEFLADQEEWRALGPQAVPILLKALEMQPGPATKPYARLWPKLPASLQKMLPRPVNYQQIHVLAWSKLATQKTKVSIPAKLVARALKEQNWGVRMNALACLNLAILPNSGTDKDQFLPLLIGAAQDPQMEVRMSAVSCLGHYREQSNLVIPVLTNALANPYPDVRIRAAMALHRVDPAAAEKARVKDVAYDCQKSSGLLSELRHGSAILATQFLKELEKPPTNERTSPLDAPPLFP